MPHRFPALVNAPEASSGRLLLSNARLFDGTGAPVRESAAVLVEDGVIRAVEDSSFPRPEGAREIDLGGRMLMPGLIDAHIHASGHPPRTLRGEEEALAGTAAHFLQAELRDLLRQGVTTIRVVGSQGQRPQEARQAMRYGAFRGPRILTCGKIISATAPGGRFYGDMYREADGPDDVRRAVREQIRAGADLIKVMTTGARSNEMEDPDPLQLTDAELAALVEEAHRMGYRVSAHAEGVAGCQAAITHGMDTIEHGMYLHERPDLLERMAENGQHLVPTLSGYYWMAGMGQVVDPADAVLELEMPPMLVELANHNLEQGTRTMRAARDAGVSIALGSDSDNAGLELLRMVHHGLSPAEALVAATGNAAVALGLKGHIGTVEAGKFADLVVIDGDVLAEPALLLDKKRIWLVVQLGALVAGHAFEQELANGGGRS